MSSNVNYLFDTTTALALVLPEEYHEEINKIRALYDRAYPRWPPHINFLFPFAPVDFFPEAENRLVNALKNFGSFELDISEIGYFTQKKCVTVHLKPKDTTKLKDLFEIITKIIPEVKPKHAEFNPHLTIAQFSKKDAQKEIQKLEEWTNNNVLKINIDHICLINRSKQDNNVPFSIHTRINLN